MPLNCFSSVPDSQHGTTCLHDLRYLNTTSASGAKAEFSGVGIVLTGELCDGLYDLLEDYDQSLVDQFEMSVQEQYLKRLDTCYTDAELFGLACWFSGIDSNGQLLHVTYWFEKHGQQLEQDQSQ